MAQEFDDKLLVRYLLRDLSQEERERIEERYFEDEQFFEELSIIEDRLIDEYLQGEMTGRERERFERQFLINQKRVEEVETSRALLGLLVQPPWYRRWRQAFQRWLRGRGLIMEVAFAGILLALALCGLWLLFERAQLRQQLEQARTLSQRKEQELQQQLDAQQKQLQQRDADRLAAGQLKEELQLTQAQLKHDEDEARRLQERLSSAQKTPLASSPERAALKVPTYVLPLYSVNTLGSNNRSQPPLLIKRGVALVRLKVYVQENNYQEYSASLQRVGGPVVWHQSIAKGRTDALGEWVLLDLPASLFKSKDYILKISAGASEANQETLALRQITVKNQNLSQD